MALESAVGITSGDVISLFNASAIFISLLATGFTLVGAIAIWRAGKDGAPAFFIGLPRA
ncbi:MAG: hypothetical protein ACMG50_00995 [Thermomonas sp.]